jgi:flagellar biosynthesis protein FlhG
MRNYNNLVRELIHEEADLLRDSYQSRQFNAPLSAAPPRVIAISGGKGGVGKTLIASNLAYACASLGMRTLIIDGDLGLSNLDVVMNLRTRGSIDDVLAGECDLEKVLIPYGTCLDVLPASSGFLKVPDLDKMHKLVLLEQIEALDGRYDLILIDTPAGVSRTVQHWASSAAQVVIVVTPEPTSLADGYATMKILNHTINESEFHLVVNMCNSEEEALHVYDRFSTVAEEYLGAKVHFLGSVQQDQNAKASIRNRALLCRHFPFSRAAVAINSIAAQLSANSDISHAKGTAQFFWRRMVNYGHGDARC